MSETIGQVVVEIRERMGALEAEVRQLREDVLSVLHEHHYRDGCPVCRAEIAEQRNRELAARVNELRAELAGRQEVDLPEVERCIP